ncbi:MAG: histidine kinase [Bacteroidetes bacterium]|nr:histidine kinase [Bacteroidota bacterium]
MIRFLAFFSILAVGLVPGALGQALPLAPVPETREVPPPPDAEAGQPFYLEHYAPRDYNAQFQNWAVTQDHRGKIYVGNLSGVLEFDGASWRLIRTTTDAWVRSLASDDSTVYVGAWGDIGYLDVDAKGNRQFESLIAEVPPSERNFEDVWGTHVTREGVFFQTDDRIFRWDGDAMHVWGGEEARKFHMSFSIQDQFFVRETGTGLWTYRNDSLVVAPGGAFFADVPVYMMAPYDEENILIGTRKQGFFLYDGTTLRPFATEVDALVAEHDLYHGTALPGGYFALATLGGGVFVIDRQGRLVRVLDQRSGVPDGFVNHVYADHQGGLWMALHNSGVARVDSPSQLTQFDRDLGLDGLIYRIVRHRGRLYVGTGAGLFYLKQHPVRPGDGPRSRFVKVPGLPPVWSMVSLEEGLLVATTEGIFLLGSGQQTKISTAQSFTLRPSQFAPGRIYVGTERGVQLLERSDAGWGARESLFVDLGEEVRSISEADANVLWLGGLEGVVTRVRLAERGRVEEVAEYGAEQGLPRRSIHVAEIQGQMMFKTLEGIFTFQSDEGDRGRFVPDDTFLPSRQGSQPDSLLAIVEDRTGDVWVVHRDRIDIGRRTGDGGYEFTTPPVLRFPKVVPVQVYAEPSGVTWISSGNELFRYDTNVQKPYQAPFHSVVRQVTDLNDQLTIFGGTVGEAVTARLTETGLPYRRNTLQFEVAASSYNNPLATEFQYYLEGADNGWSEWTEQSRRTYTSLREGTYRFRVRARSQQGVVSEEAMLTFRVLPPWYRTWWAYLAYLIALVAGAVLFMRYRVIVAENKAARKQAEELALERRLNARLKEANERLREANKLKDEFLANTSHELRTPLTAILGFTSVLQEELEGEHGEFLGLINANGQRLLHTVNSLLDLAKIRAGIVTLSSEKVDAAGQVMEMGRMLQPLAQEKDLYLTVDDPGIPVFARLDPHYFDRILYNLIGNAIKFTDEGGVTVEVNYDDEHLHVSVRDTGVGIDDTFIPHLFEAFKQESSGLGRLHEGSGLGLAITAHLIELMEGTIDVESHKGEGSVFTVTLPRNTSQAESVAPVQA